MKRLALLLVMFAIAASGAAQDDLKQIEEGLKQALVSKELTLQSPYTEKNVVLDAKGNCEVGCERGSWVGDASVIVRKVELASDALAITGDRVVVYYDDADQRRGVVSPYPIRVRIRLDQQPTNDTFSQLLAKAFRTASEPPPNGLPPDPMHSTGPFEIEERRNKRFVREKGTNEWKLPRDIDDPIQVGELFDGEKVYLVSKAVKAPHIIAAPDPTYPVEERGKRHQSKVILRVVVDRTGRIQGIKVEKSPNPAFVQPSVMALSKWKFDPATAAGRPVACVINVEVNFRLY